MANAIEILEWRLAAAKDKLRLEGAAVEAGKQRCGVILDEIDDLQIAVWKLKPVSE